MVPPEAFFSLFSRFSLRPVAGGHRTGYGDSQTDPIQAGLPVGVGCCCVGWRPFRYTVERLLRTPPTPIYLGDNWEFHSLLGPAKN